MVDGPVAERAGLGFGGLLRRLRDEAGLTQDELAEAARVSQRAISDLERGINATARKDTALLLAGALGLDGAARELFVAAARGRAPAGEALAAAAGEAGSGSAAAASRTLPRDIAAFTGRQAELGQLMARWAEAAAAAGWCRFTRSAGWPGSARPPSRCTPRTSSPTASRTGSSSCRCTPTPRGSGRSDPADALASLLLTAGVPAHQIPPGADARAARWRGHLAGKKILLVLDDAAGHEQVRPLLPGTPGSLVLITSRRRLAALEDAAVVSLDTLTPDEAAGLLARLAGRADVTAGDPGVGQIAALCGYLPLAIGMTARQLAHHPAWTAAGLAADLAAARDRLELMARREPVGRGRVRPVLPGPDRRPAAAVPPPGPAPGPRHRRLRRRGAGRHQPGRRAPPPGGPLRPAPDHRARPRPLPVPRPAPRARPDPGRRRRPGRPRRRRHPAAGLLPAHRPGRQQAHRPHGRSPKALRRRAARRPAHRRSPRPGRRPPGWRPSAPTCTRPPATPPPPRGPCTPCRSPPRWPASWRPGATGTRASPCTRPRWPPPARPGTGPARPGP